MRVDDVGRGRRGVELRADRMLCVNHFHLPVLSFPLPTTNDTLNSPDDECLTVRVPCEIVRNMTTDPFSDIIRLADVQAVVTGGFTAGGSWSIRFPVPHRIKFFAVVKGECWFQLQGERKPARLETGDVVLLSARKSFLLASDPKVAPVDATTIFGGKNPAFAKLGNSEDCTQIGGHVQLDETCGDLLADVLPGWIHIRASAPEAADLRWLLNRFVCERENELPGNGVASSMLAQLMFVQVLRIHLTEAESLPAGWLRALGDKRIARALKLMHGDPSRPWQLDELARHATMSRTTFAFHFKKLVGVAPLTYLLHWRMRIAARSLRRENTPVSELAYSLGYSSESAFSHAFARVMHVSPKRYREGTVADHTATP